MSLYGQNSKIDGVVCGLVLRGGANGQYEAVFEREYASLEEIEAIDWSQPEIEGESVLPVGYGFEVTDIRYSASTRSYTVALKVAAQYLGDVTGYQAQVGALEEQVAALEAQGSAAELTGELESAYTEGVESNG